MRVSKVNLQNPTFSSADVSSAKNRNLHTKTSSEMNDKKVALTFSALAAFGVAAVAIACKIRKGNVLSLEKFKQLGKFEKGDAILNDGKKFTGRINYIGKNGEKFLIEYYDGKLAKSFKKTLGNVDGFEKTYQYAENGIKHIYITAKDKKGSQKFITQASKDGKRTYLSEQTPDGYIRAQYFNEDGIRLKSDGEFLQGGGYKGESFRGDGKTVEALLESSPDGTRKFTKFQEDGKTIDVLNEIHLDGSEKLSVFGEDGVTLKHINEKFTDGTTKHTVFREDGKTLDLVIETLADKTKIVSHFRENGTTLDSIGKTSADGTYIFQKFDDLGNIIYHS